MPNSKTTAAALLMVGTVGITDAFSPPIHGLAGIHSSRFAPSSVSHRPSVMLANKNLDGADKDAEAEMKTTKRTAKTITTTAKSKTTTTSDADSITTTSAATLSEGLNLVFDAVDVDGSGAIDSEEYNLHLSSAGYSQDAIQRSFSEIDADGNGEISRDELQRAILSSLAEGEDVNGEDCPMGYWLDSVQQSCRPLGPIGRISQRIETLGPLKGVYTKITNLFGVDRLSLRKRGIPFLLTYSIISNVNGALSLSIAWYLTVKRTGLSPMVPGQKKSLLSSYAMIYGALQVLKPFRVAAAVAMSKLSADALDLTQERLNCSKSVAIGCQYAMGMVAMGITFYVGISIVSLITGVPIWG